MTSKSEMKRQATLDPMGFAERYWEVLERAQAAEAKLAAAEAALSRDDELEGPYWMERAQAAEAQLHELQIAADGYRKASTRREDDDRLIEEGGGYDMWLGRLLNALGGPDGLEGNR